MRVRVMFGMYLRRFVLVVCLSVCFYRGCVRVRAFVLHVFVRLFVYLFAGVVCLFSCALGSGFVFGSACVCVVVRQCVLSFVFIVGAHVQQTFVLPFGLSVLFAALACLVLFCCLFGCTRLHMRTSLLRRSCVYSFVCWFAGLCIGLR